MLVRWRAGLAGLVLLGSAGAATGCEGSYGRVPQRDVAQPSGAPVQAAPPTGDAMTAIAAGTARAGELPGTPGRDPAREADLVPVALSAFEIDGAAFPNEPGQPPTDPSIKMDYAGASAACAAAGKRLCAELEWERACTLAGAASFASAGREWTLTPGEGAMASARGAAEPTRARCGERALVERTGKLAFRCCRGAEQANGYPTPAATASDALGARPLALSVEDMRKALAGIASLAAFAPTFQPFSAGDADAALRKGKRTRDGISAWSFLPSAIAWTPTSGEELVVLAGRSGADALIAVLYPLGDGTYAHAASALLREPNVTVAIATSAAAPTPRELLWTSCYGCPNEGGSIRYGDDRRVAIEFR